MRRSHLVHPLLVALVLVVGCNSDRPRARDSRSAPPIGDRGTGAGVGKNAGRAAPVNGAPTENGEVLEVAARPTIAFLGDSLTAGYGLATDEAYPALVERLLAERGHPVRVVNAGVSGDTSAGGLARLDWLLAQKPAILFVCLGGNDGLRGLPIEATESNLRAIVERAQAAGVEVVLAGMQIPPNYGPEATTRFRELFPRLAREYELTWIPFLLEGVAADPALNLPDGIHPNAAGQRIVAATVVRTLEPLVARGAG